MEEITGSSTSADFAHNALTLNSTDASTTDSSYKWGAKMQHLHNHQLNLIIGNSPASNYGPNHNLMPTYVAYLFADDTPGQIKCGILYRHMVHLKWAVCLAQDLDQNL